MNFRKMCVTVVAILLVGCFFGSCAKQVDLQISNDLTTFIPAEKIQHNESRTIIESPSGNTLRDAVKALLEDPRTKDQMENISLKVSAVQPASFIYTFEGTTKSKPGSNLLDQDLLVDVMIEEQFGNLYYQLSFPSQP